jgi:hypothetical protein
VPQTILWYNSYNPNIFTHNEVLLHMDKSKSSYISGSPTLANILAWGRYASQNCYYPSDVSKAGGKPDDMGRANGNGAVDTDKDAAGLKTQLDADGAKLEQQMVAQRL